MDPMNYSERLERLKCCVVIPTFNNQDTLKNVLDGVLKFTSGLIVVNDGSTDSTSRILEDFPQIIQIHLPENKGKGNALREGFKKARSLGYEFVITLDSDGQHFPDDIPVFIRALEENESKDVLFIGARNMDQESVPRKSSFGNRFSNFWFRVETGIRLRDTQSGFRLYPVLAMEDLKLTTNKFEFEIEAIVKAAWKGIEVKNIPVRVHYETENRVSHFRPFRDFTRISILNTWLVFLTFFYIKPRNAVRKFKKKGFKDFLKEDLLGSKDSAEKKSLSVALGILIGMSPLWGFHTVLVLFLAVSFRLNTAIAFLFSNISIPPLIPFIVFGGLKTGSILTGEPLGISFEEINSGQEIVRHVKSYLAGSLVLAVAMAFITGFGTYVFLNIAGRKKLFNNG